MVNFKQVLTAVIIMNSIFWDITPFSPLKASQVRNHYEPGFKQNREDGGDIFLRNVCLLSVYYAVYVPADRILKRTCLPSTSIL
jgi:hypothetical protein